MSITLRFELCLMLPFRARGGCGFSWVMQMAPRSMKPMNSMRVQTSGKTSHKKESLPRSFVLRQWGCSFFSGRTFFYETLKRFEVGRWEKLNSGIACRPLVDLMWRTVMTDVRVLWLPLFPSLRDDKTPQETRKERFYWWADFTFSVKMLRAAALKS